MAEVKLTPYAAGRRSLGITVHAERQGQRLWLRFIVEGETDAILWPAPAIGRANDLWKHTCFEIFVHTSDGYREFNLSPSGQWAAYRFDGYRQGMAPAEEVATVDDLDGAENCVALEASIELPTDFGPIGLSAVIETLDGALSYWALAHPSDKPDFHHPDSFILDLT